MKRTGPVLLLKHIYCNTVSISFKAWDSNLGCKNCLCSLILLIIVFLEGVCCGLENVSIYIYKYKRF